MIPPQRVASACEHVDGAGFEHAAKIEEIEPVLARSDVHAGRCIGRGSGASPSRSSDETGSSNQETPCSANDCARSRACLRL